MRKKEVTNKMNACNGAYANMAAKYGGQCKRPPRDGISPFLTYMHF